MKLKVLNPDVLVPEIRIAAEAAARGIEVLVIEHLRKKNAATKPNKFGLPKTNYYATAAEDVASSVSGKTARVEVNAPGIVLKYTGGTIRPKKKALAMPISPAVHGIWPSERGGDLTMIWPKGKSRGYLKDPETNKLLYILLPKVTVRADKTVLPTDDEILSAAENAIMEALS